MEIKLKVTGVLNEQEIDSQFELLNIDTIEKVKASGFNGLDIWVYLLTFGGGVTIVQLAKVIMTIIEKDKTKSFTIDGTEIKGYSFRQTRELLEIKYNKGKNEGVTNENIGNS